MLHKPRMHTRPILLTLTLDRPNQQSRASNKHILHQHQRRLRRAVRLQRRHDRPRARLQEAHGRTDDPFHPVVYIRDLGVEGDGRIPQPARKRVHVVSDLVELRGWVCVGRGRCRLVVRQFGIEMDEEIVVAEDCEGAFERRAWREGRAVVELRGCV
jgi:hypothetical protein